MLDILWAFTWFRKSHLYDVISYNNKINCSYLIFSSSTNITTKSYLFFRHWVSGEQFVELLHGRIDNLRTCDWQPILSNLSFISTFPVATWWCTTWVDTRTFVTRCYGRSWAVRVWCVIEEVIKIDVWSTTDFLLWNNIQDK